MNESYNYIFKPNHPRCNKDGYTYEHIIIAEDILRRFLFKGEVVHHIDRNRRNNSPDNLMVFASDADHIRYHKSKIAELNSNGVYVSPKILFECENCSKMTSNSRFCSKKCRDLSQRHVIRPSKEELKELISKHSWLSLGRMFGVSDNAIRKWARRYNLI